MAWDRSPPTSEANPATWTGKDMLKQLRGHFASDRFMDDIEAVSTEDELRSMTFDSMVGRLRERCKPTQNETLPHCKFHRLRQNIDQSFDSFVNDVKSQAKNCSFKCASDECTVPDTLIRDQIIIGVRDEDFRKNALTNSGILKHLKVTVDELKQLQLEQLLWRNTDNQDSDG